MKEALCRPDELHWCAECCFPDCPLLGDTGGGKMGCLGHDGKITAEGLKECGICLEFDCLADFLPGDRKTIRQAISKLPAGKFQMSDVLSHYKIGRRICAWCQTPLGKILNVEGDTHGICPKCYEAVRKK